MAKEAGDRTSVGGDESWKGEHLIRSRTLTAKQRKQNVHSATSKMFHEQVKASGEVHPGKRRHETFMRALHVSLKKPPGA